MLITFSSCTAICQPFAEVQLTGVAPLGAVSQRLIFLNLFNVRSCSQKGKRWCAFKILTGILIEKRSLGTPRRSWEDNIRLDPKQNRYLYEVVGRFVSGQGLLESPTQCVIETLVSMELVIDKSLYNQWVLKSIPVIRDLEEKYFLQGWLQC